MNGPVRLVSVVVMLMPEGRKGNPIIINSRLMLL